MKLWDEMTPEEREQYINQDQVPRRDLLIEDFDNFNFSSPWVMNVVTKYNLRRIVYYLYFIDQKDYTEIQYHINISNSYFYYIINQVIYYQLNGEYEELAKFLNIPRATAYNLLNYSYNEKNSGQ